MRYSEWHVTFIPGRNDHGIKNRRFLLKKETLNDRIYIDTEVRIVNFSGFWLPVKTLVLNLQTPIN